MRIGMSRLSPKSYNYPSPSEYFYLCLRITAFRFTDRCPSALNSYFSLSYMRDDGRKFIDIRRRYVDCFWY